MAHQRLALAASLGLAGLLLTACGGGDDAAADPTPSAESSSASSATASASPSESTGADPAVTPATGALLQLDNAEYHAPDGWQKAPFLIDMETEARPSEGGGAARLTAIEMPAGSSYEMPIDLQATQALQSTSIRPKPKKLEPVEIAGVEWYHLAGPADSSVHLDTFGTIHDGYQTTIDFELPRDLSAAEREQTIAASLATFTWR